MEMLASLFYAFFAIGIVALALKVTRPTYIDPEEDADIPDYVNIPTDLAKLELNVVLMEAVDGRIDRLKRINQDSLDDLKQDIILIALAYGEGCVRHAENRMN
jgi:hypothetical protein